MDMDDSNRGGSELGDTPAPGEPSESIADPRPGAASTPDGVAKPTPASRSGDVPTPGDAAEASADSSAGPAKPRARRRRLEDEASAGGAAPAWRTEFIRGLRKLAAGEFERAAAHFASAHRRAPRQPEVCFALGRERYRQGNLAEAEPLLRAAWTEDPTLSVAAGALARCLGTGLHQVEAAYQVLDQALAEHPDEPGLLVVRAELLLEEKRAAEARQVLERARGLLRGNAGRRTAVGAAATAAMARVLNLEGVDLAQQGKADEALFVFKRASDLDPDWSAPIVNMGAAFAQLGRTARAASCYERALAHEPDNTVARFNLAKLARERGDLERAIDGYRLVLKADPAYPGGRVALAELLLEQGQATDALGLLEAQATQFPDDADARFHLGVACEATGNRDGAEHQLRLALALDESHVPATCQLARLLAGAGRSDEASALAGRARTLDAARAERYLGPAGL